MKEEEKVSDLEWIKLGRFDVYDEYNERYLRDLYAANTDGRTMYMDKLGNLYYRMELHSISFEKSRLYANDNYLYAEYVDKWKRYFIYEEIPTAQVIVIGYMTIDELFDSHLKFTYLQI
jgi:hypothetical protein